MTGDTWQVVVGTALMGVAVYGIVRYPGLLYRSVQQMRGGWRVAALLPLLVLIPVLVVTIYGLWQGSNLWPLFLIFLAPVLLLYQVGLFALHKWVQHRSTAPAP